MFKSDLGNSGLYKGRNFALVVGWWHQSTLFDSRSERSPGHDVVFVPQILVILHSSCRETCHLRHSNIHLRF